MLVACCLSPFASAQSVTFGLYGRVSPDYLTPTLEAAVPLGELNLSLRAQRDALGAGLDSALDLGPAGRVAYGARAALGFAGWGAEGFARGGVGPVALEARLGYYSAPRAELWAGDRDPFRPAAAGFSGFVSGRYRVTPTQTAGLSLEYLGALAAEATYALRSDATYTFGLGYAGFAGGVYGLAGWRGELDEAGSLLDVTLRAGLYNRLDALYSTPLDEENNLNLRFTAAYPWAARVGVEAANIRLEAAYDGGFSAWLRYTINFGGEE